MTVRKIIYALIAFAGLSALSLSAQRPGQLIMKAELDSTVMEMGRQTTLHLEIIGELPDSVPLLLPDSIWQDVEISKVGAQKITDLGNGRRQMLADIIVQSFDSGVYTLPPVMCIVGGDTFASNRPVLKVLPCDVDTLKSIHDYADVLSPKRQIFDYVPDWFADYGWWILLILAVAGFGIWWLVTHRKKGEPAAVKVEKQEPPYEMAMRMLEELRTEGLCERGEEKAYYTRLTDILRVYLDRRFGISAMEMTSTQIRHALQHNEATRLSGKMLNSVLEMADFVKFAKVRPLPDDNAAVMRSAIKFVDETKPQPEPEVKPEADSADGQPTRNPS